MLRILKGVKELYKPWSFRGSKNISLDKHMANLLGRGLAGLPVESNAFACLIHLEKGTLLHLL